MRAADSSRWLKSLIPFILLGLLIPSGAATAWADAEPTKDVKPGASGSGEENSCAQGHSGP